MDEKKKVYVETSVISNLTARPTYNLIDMARQVSRLLDATAVPRTSYEDAVHIAAATVSGMDYLLTWNCKHIANAATMPKIYKVCGEANYRCPVICTPDQLGEEDSDE